ncbi:hypothetical protein FHW89_004625 [Mucilaginibacter sp. SG564]|nr:hypothetical protein [Mucilaginibacter sp. SG564]
MEVLIDTYDLKDSQSPKNYRSTYLISICLRTVFASSRLAMSMRNTPSV